MGCGRGRRVGSSDRFVEAPLSPYPINGDDYVFPGEMAGFPIEGYWRAIDTAKDIREATRELDAAGG